MQILLIIAIAVHVLSSIFWAGSTFVRARAGGANPGLLFRPQLGSATVSVLPGALLWDLLRPRHFGTSEAVPGIGAGAALLGRLPPFPS